MIRKATKNDVDVIQDMLGMFYFVPKIGIVDLLDNIVVKQIKEEVVGMLYVNKKRDSIKMLIVKNKYKERGIGRELFERGSELLNINLKGMIIEATCLPKSTVLFWEKMGFKPIKEKLTKRGNKMMLMEYVK